MRTHMNPLYIFLSNQQNLNFFLEGNLKRKKGGKEKKQENIKNADFR